MTRRKDMLQRRYYQLSRENRALVIALAGELAARKQPLPDACNGWESSGPPDGQPGGPDKPLSTS